MKKVEAIKIPIEGLVVVKVATFKDHRGFFSETYNLKAYEDIGIDANFVQDNESFSKKGVLRGLHFQVKHPQGKLVRVNKGKVFDVAVDLRKESPTFAKWFGLILSEKNHLQFYIPPGFAHGFLSLTDDTHFLYKCTDYYYPELESGIIWNDQTVGIKWPTALVREVIISDKDKKLFTFKEATKNI